MASNSRKDQKSKMNGPKPFICTCTRILTAEFHHFVGVNGFMNRSEDAKTEYRLDPGGPITPFDATKLRTILETSYDCREMFFSSLTYTELLEATRILKLELSDREKYTFLNPARLILQDVERIKDFKRKGWGLTLFGSEAGDMLDFLQSPMEWIASWSQAEYGPEVRFRHGKIRCHISFVHPHFKGNTDSAYSKELGSWKHPCGCGCVESLPEGEFYRENSLYPELALWQTSDGINVTLRISQRDCDEDSRRYMGWRPPIYTEMTEMHRTLFTWHREDGSHTIDYVHLNEFPFVLKHAEALRTESDRRQHEVHRIVRYGPEMMALMTGREGIDWLKLPKRIQNCERIENFPAEDDVPRMKCYYPALTASIPTLPCCENEEGQWILGKALKDILGRVEPTEDCDCACHPDVEVESELDYDLEKKAVSDYGFEGTGICHQGARTLENQRTRQNNEYFDT